MAECVTHNISPAQIAKRLQQVLLLMVVLPSILRSVLTQSAPFLQESQLRTVYRMVPNLPGRARRVFRSAQAAPDSSNASRALMIMGRFEEAKKILDQWRQKGSLISSQMEQRYRIAFFENDAATMERLAREVPADDMLWLGLRQQLAFFRGDSGKLRSLSETLVNQQRRAQRMENAANELAWHARLESYLGNYGLRRNLCLQAGEASKDSNLGLGHCAKALAEAGDVTQAEALAAKLDRLRPEDTLNQQVHLPLIRSIIERERGNAAKAVDLLAPVTRYEEGEPQVLYHRARAYLAAGENAKAAVEFA